MGRVRLADLDPDLFEERPEDPNGMAPIGRRRVAQPVDAMRIGTARGSESELVFVGDVAAEVRNKRRRVTAGDGQSAAWIRFEVSTRRGKKADGGTDGVALASTGDEIVVAEYPWSQEWVQASTLRRANKDGLSPEEDWAGLDSRGLVERVESLDYDLFETNGGILTAAISEPRMSFELSSPRDAKGKLFEVFGLCPDFEAVTRSLFGSGPIQELLEQTDKLKLRVAPVAANRKLAHHRLPEEVRDEANSLMLLSIQQALAGPAEDSEEEESAYLEWIERPVSSLVDRIYRGHVWNLVKRNQNRRDAERKFWDLLGMTSPPEASEEEEG